MIVMYEGRDISDSIDLQACVYDSREFGRLPELRAEFRDADGLWGRWRPKPGDSIEIKDAGAPSTGTLKVASVEPASGSMILRATPIGPVPGAGDRQWRDAPFRSIAAQLARALGLSASFHGASGPTFKRFGMHGETPLSALGRLCAMCGCTIDAHGGRLHICGRSWTESQTSAGTLEIEPADWYEYRERPRYGSMTVVQDPNYLWDERNWEFDAKADEYSASTGHEAASGAGKAKGSSKWRPKKKADRREALSATATGSGPLSKTVVLDRGAWLETSGAVQQIARGLLEHCNARRSGGAVEESDLSPFTPGAVCTVECPENPMIEGRAVVTRVRNDFAGGDSKTWWRPI